MDGFETRTKKKNPKPIMEHKTVFSPVQLPIK